MTGARRRVAAVLVLLAAAGAAAAWLLGRGAAERPDIVVLLWDTTRADRLSAYGYARPTTPWLESLARDGVLYEQCRAPSPWTVPSHASLFTGLLPRHHGAVDLESPLAPTHRTLAERLAAEGYDTVLVSNNPLVGPQSGLAQGFATFVPVPERKGAPGVGPTREVLQTLLEVRRGDPERSARPLFLFVNLMEPHLPYDPPESAERPWRPEGAAEREVREAKLFQFPDDMAHNLGLRPLTPSRLAILSSLYDAEIRTLDAGCAEIEALLAREGVLGGGKGGGGKGGGGKGGGGGRGHLLAVTSDHGENIGEHGLVDHKLSVADTLLHVPLVIRSPGRFEGGRRVPSEVRLQDLFATLLDVAGAPPAAGEAPRSATLLGVDGPGRFQVGDFRPPLSFLEGMRRFFPGAPEPAFLPFRRGLLTAVAPLEGRRRLKWTRETLAVAPGREDPVRESLFDLAADPWEERDLLAGPSPAPGDLEAARRMAAEADAWVAPR